MNKSAGFSLIELMVAVVILGIIAGLAVPNMGRAIESSRVGTQASELLSAIESARREAIRRGAPVRISAGVNGDGDNFAQGWCVHADADCSEPINQREALNLLNEDQVEINPAATAQLVFGRLGQLQDPGVDEDDGLAVDISPSEANCPAGELLVRRVSVFPSGRASITRVACD